MPPTEPDYVIRFRSTPHATPVAQRLKRLLKYAGRHLGLRAIYLEAAKEQQPKSEGEPNVPTS